MPWGQTQGKHHCRHCGALAGTMACVCVRPLWYIRKGTAPKLSESHKGVPLGCESSEGAASSRQPPPQDRHSAWLVACRWISSLTQLVEGISVLGTFCTSVYDDSCVSVRLWGQAWIPVQAPSLTSCVTSGQSLDLSEPPSPHQENEGGCKERIKMQT